MRGLTIYFPVRSTLLILLGSFALMWPALINGGPFWFPDTSNYVRAADAAVVYTTGQRSEWSDRLAAVRKEAADSVSPAEAGREANNKLKPTRPVYAGRSIYYGFFLYLPMMLFGSWGAILFQALITAGVLFYVGRILARELRLAPSPHLIWACGVLALATPLPFYTSMLMPDVYSGLLILTLALTVTFFAKLSLTERCVLVLASALFVTFHTTHLLVAGAIAAIALLVAIVGRRPLRPVAAAIPVVLIGAISMILFNFAVKTALNEKPFSPPFLSARLTAAGLGTDYLNRICTHAKEPFVLCRYRARLPLESDSFLWSNDPRTGLFQMVRKEEQIALANQDRKFFFATLADDPIAFVGAASQASLEQLFSFGLKNFNYPVVRTEALFEKYPNRFAESIASTRAAQRSMPVAPFVWLSIASTLAALGTIVAIAGRLRRDRRAHVPKELWDFVLLVLLGVLANAAICGALSGPHDRYQMRLIWIVPFASLWLITAWRLKKSQKAV